MISTENILLFLLLVFVIVMIIHHRISIEPFISNTPLSQATVDETLSDITNKMDSLERVYNSEEGIEKDPEFPDFLEKIDAQLQVMTNRMNEVATSKSSYAIDKIKKLQNQLTYLNRETEKLKEIREPNTIKSLQNGLNISVLGTDNGNFLIAVNGGCIKVSSNGSYDITKCKPNSQSEQFRIINVYDRSGYNKELLPNDEVREDDEISYPFAVIKSINTGNYLKNHFGKISVEPLVVSKGQRWKLLENSIKCNK
jgi:hypothetical protein